VVVLSVLVAAAYALLKASLLVVVDDSDAGV